MYRNIVYPSECTFQYGNYLPQPNGLADVIVEVRQGTGVRIPGPSYVFIYQKGCPNYAISRYVTNTVNGVVNFPSDVFERGYSYYAVWRTEGGPNIAQSCDIIAGNPVLNPNPRQIFQQPDPIYINRRRQAINEAGNSIYYWGLEEAERDVLRQYFDQIDRNGDGNVTHAELQSYYSNVVGTSLTSNEIAGKSQHITLIFPLINQLNIPLSRYGKRSGHFPS